MLLSNQFFGQILFLLNRIFFLINFISLNQIMFTFNVIVTEILRIFFFSTITINRNNSIHYRLKFMCRFRFGNLLIHKNARNSLKIPIAQKILANLLSSTWNYFIHKFCFLFIKFTAIILYFFFSSNNCLTHSKTLFFSQNK